MRDGVTLWRRLSLGGRKPRASRDVRNTDLFACNKQISQMRVARREPEGDQNRQLKVPYVF